MKKLLSRLPYHKQVELREIIDLIHKEADLKMIILFGSYARAWLKFNASLTETK
jgi:predicted nucleotidyltransferase